MSKSIAISKENIEAIQPIIKSSIEKRYGEKRARQAAAERANYYAKEFLFNRPIGMNSNFRIADLQVEMSDYIHKRFEEDTPKGFLFGGELILMWILSGIISFIVSKILSSLLDQYNDG